MFKGMSIILSVSFASMVWAGPMVEINNQETLENYISKGKFNGVVLVARDKQILLKKAFGYKNLEKNDVLTVNDKFLIGSNTKQFVAASILKLQEAGKLLLDDKITRYLPLLTEYKNVTIRDVLNHTSGIPNYTDIPEFWNDINYENVLGLDDILNFVKTYPLNFEVKSQYQYSNTGYIIAGKIVEKLSGESWDQFIKEEFLSPLKMASTGYDKFFENVSDVTGHVRINGTLVPYERELNTTWALSAGAMYSTVDDLLKWTDVYVHSEILNETSKVLMQTPFKANYGLGINVYPFHNQTQIYHGGRVPGMVSNVSYLKETGLTVVTLDNIDGKISVFNALMDFYTDGKATAVKNEVYPMDKEILKDFTGNYKLGNMIVSVFIKDGTLFLKPDDGQPAYELIANDKDSFRLVPANFGEEFVRDADGKVVKLKHYQNGKISYAEKVDSN